MEKLHTLENIDHNGVWKKTRFGTEDNSQAVANFLEGLGTLSGHWRLCNRCRGGELLVISLVLGPMERYLRMRFPEATT